MIYERPYGCDPPGSSSDALGHETAIDPKVKQKVMNFLASNICDNMIEVFVKNSAHYGWVVYEHPKDAYNWVIQKQAKLYWLFTFSYFRMV